MSFANWLFALKRRSFVRGNSHTRRRKSRSPFTSQFIKLEDRCLLSAYYPTLTNTATSLGQVLYTQNPYSTASPSVPANVPQKLLTIMNNSPNVVYPIIIDANSTLDGTVGQIVRIDFNLATGGGSGYSSQYPPTVSFVGGNGSGAVQPIASVNGQGQIFAVQFPKGTDFTGSGYTTAPTIQFDDTAHFNATGMRGSGAQATAVISTVPNTGTQASYSIYDPLDPLNQGYRGYIGETGVDPNNPNAVVEGLQPYTQVTVQLPLVFWDGARVFFATNGTSAFSGVSDPANPLNPNSLYQFNPAAPAFMPAPGDPYSATFADPAQTAPSANSNGRVLWYHDTNGLLTGPKGFASDAPGQLAEFTIRDTNQSAFAPNMPSSQLLPIDNYDVSYVDQLGLPAMMEATNSFPTTNPDITGPFAGIGADLSVQQMQQLIAQFTQTTPGTPNSILGNYFGGMGYDQYVFPSSVTNFELLPGGFNLFADSALSDTESAYNAGLFQEFKLVSGGGTYRVDTTGLPNNANGVVTVDSNVITGINPAKVALLAKGMLVLNSGQGPGGAGQGIYFPAGTYITSVDTVNDQITVSNPAFFDNSGNSGGTFAVTFLGSQWSSATGSTDGTTPQISGIDPAAAQYLSPGMAVSGPGLTNYATVAAVNPLSGVTIAAGGTGYAVNDVLKLTGGSFTATPATLTVTSVGAGGVITGVNVTTSGSYSSIPTNPVSASGGTGSGATFTAVFLNGVVTLVDASGNAVVPAATTAASPPDSLASAVIATGGTGYTVGEVLNLSGTGTFTTLAQVKVTSVDANGAITGLIVQTGGSYSVIPSPTTGLGLLGPTGSGAAINATFSPIGYVFGGAPSSYLANQLINLWYAWADYYVQNVSAPTTNMNTIDGSTTGTNDPTDKNALNLTLTNGGSASASNLQVGDVVSGPNIGTNYLTGALIAKGGTGYKIGDILTVVGGTVTPGSGFSAATLTVTQVNAAGGITGLAINSSAPGATVSYSIPPTGLVTVNSNGAGIGASLDITTGSTTIARILSDTSIELSNAVLTSTANQAYTFTAPVAVPRSSDAPAFGANALNFNGFTAPYGETPLSFAQTVYDLMISFSHIGPTNTKLSMSAQLLSNLIGCNTGFFAGTQALPALRGSEQLRDELKSVLRGVSDFTSFPEFGNAQSGPSTTSLWYPNPATALSNAFINGAQSTFNVFNLNPYVFFVHKTLGMNGYGFSVDDDTADVGSTGSNVEIAFGTTVATPPGTKQGILNLNYYAPGNHFGPLQATGSVDTTSGYAMGQPAGLTVIMVPTEVAAKLTASDATTPGALVSASDGSVPAGTRVVTLSSVGKPDPTYPAGMGAVIVQAPPGTTISPSKNVTYTFTSFNTLLPVVSGFSQSGSTVTITGDQFGFTPLGTTKFVPAVLSVTFNGIPAVFGTINIINKNTLTVTVPASATSGKIAVRSAAGTGYSTSDFIVTGGAAPTLLSASPPSGSLGQKITLTGTGFLAGNVSITIGGTPVLGFDPVTSDTTITGVIVPDFGATSGNILVTTNNGATTQTVTYFVNAPSFTSNIAMGPVGTPFTLTGTGFTGTNRATGVTVNGVAATNVTVVNDATITGTVALGTPTGAASISVMTSGGIGSTPFTVTAAVTPSITSFSPGSGVVQTIVTLTGSGFLGTTGVTFGGVAATSFTVNSDTSIVVTVPPLAVTGPIAVTNAAGTSPPSATFTVNPTSFPVIGSFSPTGGPVGTQVQITGSGFTNASDVEFNGTPASFVIINDNLIACVVPNGVTSGLITVTNLAGTTFSAQSFFVGVPTPAITSANSTTFNVFSLNGTSANGSTALTNIANVSQLATGMFVSGPGIAAGTSITVAGSTVTLSAAAETGAGTGPFVFSDSTFQVTATNASSLAIVGSLPAGVTFTDNGDGTATLAGAPTFDTGNSVFQIVATNNNTSPASTATQIFTLTISAPPLLTVTVNNAPVISATYTVGTTNPVIKLATSAPFGTTLGSKLTVTGLPKGVVFTPSSTVPGTGTISVSPTPGPSAGTGGVYPVTITASNATGSTVQVFTLTVNQPTPSFVTAAATTLTVGQAGSYIVRAIGFPTLPTITTTATFPTGVIFTSVPNVTGVSGTSTVGSNTLTVTSTAGIVVGMGVTGTGIANGTTVAAINGTTVTLSANANVLAGAGTFNFGGIATITSTTAAAALAAKAFTITAAIGALKANQTFTLTITQPTYKITSAMNTAFQQGSTGTFTVTTTGFPTATLSATGAVFTGTITSGKISVTGVSTTAGYAIGETVTGSGIPAGTTIASITAATKVITLSQAATATKATTLTIGLPTGLAFTDNGNGTATIQGVSPLASAGTNFTIVISAKVGTLTKASQLFSLGVVNYTQATGTVATFKAGVAGTTATIAGTFPAGTTFTAINGKLPAGITLARSATGITVSGTPTVAGSYSFQILSNGNSTSAVSPVYTIVVNQALPVITSAKTATFTVGQANRFTVTTTGFPFAQLAIANGFLPLGLSFTDNGNGTAALSGSLERGDGGTYNFTISANNSLVTQAFVLTVSEAPIFTSANSGGLTLNTLGSFQVTATGFPTPTLTVTGTLPAGVTFVAKGNGVAALQGTPTRSGTFRFFITATSGTFVSVQEFTLTVQ